MKKLKPLLLTVGLLSATQANAVGIDSKELLFECTGDAQFTQVNKTGVSSGFYDRAGNYHPAHGYAYLNLEITSTSPECDQMEQKLDINIGSKIFEQYISFPTVNEQEIKLLAEKKVGEIHPFKAQQNFNYMDKDGYLPLFPLIHGESVTLESSTANVNSPYQVDEEKVYEIHLNEDDKILLSELVFEYLDGKDTNGLYLPSVISQMFENHPKFTDNFKVFLSEALKHYQTLEENPEAKKGTYLKYLLETFASGIKELTHKTPESSNFDMPNLLVDHPSMVNFTSWHTNKAKCPNISAVQLEKALEILQTKLASGTLNNVVKLTWEKPLKELAGFVFPGGCLNQVASAQAKQLATQLWNEYY